MNARLTAGSWLDWKLGARLLLKYPGLTIIGGLSLAAAIAIGAVGVELADELLYKRLPFPDGGRVVRLETQDLAASRVEPRMLHDFAIWRQSLKTVVEISAARLSDRNVLTGEGRVESLPLAEITASAFPLTRVPALLGRPLQPADEAPGAEPVVILGYDVWQRQFLHDPQIIGRVVTVGRTARTVVGVMPPRFGFPRNQQIWVPLPVEHLTSAAAREGPPVEVFGRLADGASWQDAAAELAVVSARAAADQPATRAQLRTRVRAFAGRTPGDPLRLEDLAIHAIVILLLGAVCANVATLVFARTVMRESEIVVRHALGASRARVVAQIVTESFVLTLTAAVLGLVIAQTTVRYAWARATQIIGGDLPFWVDVELEPTTIAYALLLALVAAALIGLLPALKATGASVREGLQGITGTGGTMKFGGIWSFIIGAQVAFTLLCVPAAVGIFANTLPDRSERAAFPTGRYLTFNLSVDTEALAGERGDDAEIGARRARAYEELAGRLREEPGVTDVTLGDRLPTTSPDWVALEMEQDGAPPARLTGNYEGGFAMAAVGAGYHDTFGGRIVAGRALRASDAGGQDSPVLVNQRFMRVVGRNPVGLRIRTIPRSDGQPGPWHEVVGVVSDLWTFPADWGGAAYIYRAASAAELDPVVVGVRVAGDAAPFVPRVAVLAGQGDAGLHIRNAVTLDDIVAQEQMRMITGSVIFGSVLFVAVVFSAAGLYALMSVAVARRTREIGIRLALGASTRHVLGSVFARAGRQLGGGIIAGNSLILFLAWRADSLTAGLLVSSVITSVLMAIVGVLACAAPARRALRIQPTEALRQS